MAEGALLSPVPSLLAAERGLVSLNFQSLLLLVDEGGGLGEGGVAGAGGQVGVEAVLLDAPLGPLGEQAQRREQCWRKRSFSMVGLGQKVDRGHRGQGRAAC